MWERESERREPKHKEDHSGLFSHRRNPFNLSTSSHRSPREHGSRQHLSCLFSVIFALGGKSSVSACAFNRQGTVGVRVFIFRSSFFLFQDAAVPVLKEVCQMSHFLEGESEARREGRREELYFLFFSGVFLP